jgi:hypothetical protein
MIDHLRAAAEPSPQRAARPERRQHLAQGDEQVRPRRLAVLALLVLTATPPPACSAVPGTAPGLRLSSTRSAELGVDAAAFAELPAAARGLVGLLIGTEASAGAYINGLRLERTMRAGAPRYGWRAVRGQARQRHSRRGGRRSRGTALRRE